MNIFRRSEPKPQPMPITDTINRAAAILGIDRTAPHVPSLATGFLWQAQIIEELARRIVALESK